MLSGFAIVAIIIFLFVGAHTRSILKNEKLERQRNARSSHRYNYVDPSQLKLENENLKKQIIKLQNEKIELQKENRHLHIRIEKMINRLENAGLL